MSWKPEFKIINDPKWYDNAVRFATEDEAMRNAEAKFRAWTAAEEYRAVQSDDPVNYQYSKDGRLIRIEGEKF